MQKLTILICGRAAGDVQARRKDITAWLQSLTPGKGKLNTEARTEQQTSYKSDCRVSVPAPKGFYTELHEGEGFHDATYARLGKRNAPVEQFSVQVGDHPQLRVKELLASQQQTQSGTMAEQKAEWHLFEEAELLFAECVLPPSAPAGASRLSPLGRGSGRKNRKSSTCTSPSSPKRRMPALS